MGATRSRWDSTVRSFCARSSDRGLRFVAATIGVVLSPTVCSDLMHRLFCSAHNAASRSCHCQARSWPHKPTAMTKLRPSLSPQRSSVTPPSSCNSADDPAAMPDPSDGHRIGPLVQQLPTDR
eukprot:6175223-Pleurochrysis_carterae.AAC.4